jgi:hypothetical protein
MATMPASLWMEPANGLSQAPYQGALPMDSWPVVITAAAFATVIIAYGFIFAA